MIKVLCSCVAMVALGMSAVAWGQGQPAAEAKPMWVFVGTSGTGIYVSRMDGGTGRLTKPELAAETKGASYVWVHPNGKTLLATGQVAVDGKVTGALRSFAIEGGTGRLVELNAQPTGGAGPCYVATDRAGRFALAANYGSGSVSVMPVREDGKLAGVSAFVQHAGTGPNVKRQAGPHAHSFDFDPGERFVVACDLGIDEVKVYRFEKEGGTLTEAGSAKVAPGAGPRHVAFSGEGKFMYVINEMACTVTAFAYDGETGKATEVQTVGTLPAGHEQTDKDTGSEIFVHPTGRWVYASNRGHDSIVRFAVDGTSGKLSEPKWVASGGKIPRYFGIDPAGKWMLVANQGTGNVLTFKIDPQSGELAATGDGVEVGGATCVKFLVGE